MMALYRIGKPLLLPILKAATGRGHPEALGSVWLGARGASQSVEVGPARVSRVHLACRPAPARCPLTLLHLPGPLARLPAVEPSSGRIVIDGIDTASIGLYDLRSRLALVPQVVLLPRP